MIFDRPTRSCGRPPRTLLGRSPTAGRRRDRLPRRSPRSVRGRTDLPFAADRPAHLLRPCRRAAGSAAPVCETPSCGPPVSGTRAGRLWVCVFRGSVSEGGVDQPSVVAGLGVVRTDRVRLPCGWASPLVSAFDLEGAGGAFHRGSVTTACRPARRRLRLRCGAPSAERLGSALAAAVGMADEALGRSLPLRGHHRGGQRRRGAHVVAHGPTGDLAGCQVEDGSKAQPAFAGRDAGDVGQPDAARRRRDERLPQQVRRDRQAMAAVGGAWPEPATGGRADAVAPRRSCDTRPRPAVLALRAERGMHPGAARNGPSTVGTVAPCMSPLAETSRVRHIGRIGQRSAWSRMGPRLTRGTSAKMQVASSGTSRSARTRSSPRFERAISDARPAGDGIRGTVDAVAPDRTDPPRTAARQFRNEGERPASAAPCPSGRPPQSSSTTASRPNPRETSRPPSASGTPMHQQARQGRPTTRETISPYRSV